MAFDKNKYDNEYRKAHYVQKNLRLKPDLAQEIADYLYWHKMNFTEFVVKSIRYYLDHQHTEK